MRYQLVYSAITTPVGPSFDDHLVLYLFPRCSKKDVGRIIPTERYISDFVSAFGRGRVWAHLSVFSYTHLLR